MVEKTLESKPGSKVTVELAGAEALPGLEEEWEALFDRVGCDNPFLSCEWAQICLRHLKEGSTPVFALARRDGRLVGVGAFETAPLKPFGRELRFLGWPHGDYRGILIEDGQSKNTPAALLDSVLQAGGFDRVRLERFREGTEGCAGALQALERAGRAQRRVAGMSCVLELDGDYDSYLRGRSKNLRREVRKSANHAKTDGRVASFSRLTSLDDNFLREMFEIHQLRHAHKEGTGVFARSSGREFFRDVSATMASKGWLDVVAMHLDGELIGFSYGLRVRGTHFTWLCGFRPSAERYYPGIALVEYLIRTSSKMGLSTIDFMIGVEQYKTRWATGNREHYGIDCLLPGHAIAHGLQDGSRVLHDSLRRVKDANPLVNELWTRMVGRG